MTYKFRRLFGALRIPVFTLLPAILLVSAQVSAQEVSSETEQKSAAPAMTRKGEAGGQSTIRGRVVFDDTGRPARRAAVMLFTNLKHPAVRRTVANRRGEFRFGGLGAGTYFLLADAPGTVSLSSGFQLSDLGLMSAGADEDQVRVSVDGNKEAQTEVRVRPGGAISGRITYGDNEPVLRGRIVLYRRQGASVVPFFTDPVLTDDRGVYRVEGLPAGDYLIGVVERYAGVDKILPGERPALASAYYPAAKGAQDAKVVQVTAGDEAKDINIKLVEDNLRRISGKVVWRSTGLPVESATVLLQRRDDPTVEVSFLDLIQNITPPGTDKDDTLMRDMALLMMMMSETPHTEADAKGHWSFADLTSGTYILTASAPVPAKESESAAKGEQSELDKQIAASNRPMVTQRLEVTISGDGEADVKLELSEGGRISGEIIAEDPPAPGASVMLEYKGAHPLLNQPYYANQDGTFLLEGVPAGEVRLDVRLQTGSTHYVKSISAGGVDLLRAPLRVTEGAELSGVRITLARGRATLSGRITASEGGAPVGGAGVLLVPADERLWPVRGARIFGRSDAEGDYSVNGAPGDYLVFIWSPKDEPTQSIEEYVRSRFATARRISLQSSESKKIDLIVNASSSTHKRD